MKGSGNWQQSNQCLLSPPIVGSRCLRLKPLLKAQKSVFERPWCFAFLPVLEILEGEKLTLRMYLQPSPCPLSYSISVTNTSLADGYPGQGGWDFLPEDGKIMNRVKVGTINSINIALKFIRNAKFQAPPKSETESDVQQAVF